ncbi:MAG TPA: chloride channel protein [Dongiaceae bacterium]|jgi:H+/Cl- antiporter ClcA/CBS domain-containing protein|nr:chloride channel protein [Dongiaceae bacterium]
MRHPTDTLRDFTADRRLLILAAMALVVGTTGAIAAWALTRLIAICTNFAYYGRFSTTTVSIAGNHLGFWAVLVPVAGCLIIGLMARYGSEKIRGHGIPEAMEAILIGRSRIQPKVAVLKPLSSAISIGSGGPFGAEGPIIMTGGAIGSLFAQLFHLSNAERKTLLVAGAAAGMSATFGTPIAAMLLAVELLLFEWKPRSFVPVAIATTVAAAWRPYLLASGVLFPMPESAALAPLGLLIAAGLGIVAGLASGTLTAMVYFCEDFFQRLPIHWMWWPAFGGLVIGLGGLVDPRALGVGYDNIQALLNGNIGAVSAVTLIVVKAVIWSVALGSGTSGGVLAPLLIMGGALGAILGNWIPMGDDGLWALVGMAAMMGGTMRSPLTSMIFALELTHNIGAFLPLAIGCTMAHATTVLLLKRSILTEKVARRGYHVLREYIVDPFEIMRVGDIMAKPVDTLPATMKVGEAVAFFTASESADGQLPTRHKSYPVVNQANGLVAMVSRADALRWTVAGWNSERTLGEQLLGQNLVVGYEDELVGKLADRMAEVDAGRIPILRRGASDEESTVVGLVARRDLLRVRAEVIRHERDREKLIRLRA